MAARYGDRSARNAVFAESATQLRLEAAALQNDKPLRPAALLPIAQVRPRTVPFIPHRRERSHCHGKCVRVCCSQQRACTIGDVYKLVAGHTALVF